MISSVIFGFWQPQEVQLKDEEADVISHGRKSSSNKFLICSWLQPENAPVYGFCVHLHKTVFKFYFFSAPSDNCYATDY